MIASRVGFGYDVHSFIAGRKLILGGIEIPHTHGLDGHSDADALLHALCDALLGAAGLGDIGEMFPNTDNKFKDISSVILLEEVLKHIRALGWSVENVDMTVLAEKPKLMSYKSLMRSQIALVMGVKEDQVNIKATTNEGMGFIGRSEGIAAYAVALLTRKT